MNYLIPNDNPDTYLMNDLLYFLEEEIPLVDLRSENKNTEKYQKAKFRLDNTLEAIKRNYENLNYDQKPSF